MGIQQILLQIANQNCKIWHAHIVVFSVWWERVSKKEKSDKSLLMTMSMTGQWAYFIFTSSRREKNMLKKERLSWVSLGLGWQQILEMDNPATCIHKLVFSLYWIGVYHTGSPEDLQICGIHTEMPSQCFDIDSVSIIDLIPYKK